MEENLGQGQVAALYDTTTGNAKVLRGPLKIKLQNNHMLETLHPYDADYQHFLRIQKVDGQVELVPGPATRFKNPNYDLSIKVLPALMVHSNEAIVIYRAPTEDQRRPHTRHILRGPARYIPQNANEWLHSFHWKNLELDSLQHTYKVNLSPRADTYTVRGLLCSDGRVRQARLLLFCRIQSVERLIDTTSDPVSAIEAAITADIQSKLYTDFEKFLKLSNASPTGSVSPRASTLCPVNKSVRRLDSQQLSDCVMSMHTTDFSEVLKCAASIGMEIPRVQPVGITEEVEPLSEMEELEQQLIKTAVRVAVENDIKVRTRLADQEIDIAGRGQLGGLVNVLVEQQLKIAAEANAAAAAAAKVAGEAGKDNQKVLACCCCSIATKSKRNYGYSLAGSGEGSGGGRGVLDELVGVNVAGQGMLSGGGNVDLSVGGGEVDVEARVKNDVQTKGELSATPAPAPPAPTPAPAPAIPI